MGKIYRTRKVLTIVGGPHAKAFPTDCLRFFDLVVQDCDKTLIDDILRGRFERHSVITSGRLLNEIPCVEERTPEIIGASLVRSGSRRMNVVPLLSSIGCPYTCDFCVDWNNPYVLFPPELLEADLRFLSEQRPGVMVTYHDPNFGVKFDQVLNVIEKVPKERRVHPQKRSRWPGCSSCRLSSPCDSKGPSRNRPEGCRAPWLARSLPQPLTPWAT